MITDQQRAERINYIGSSDASAILGLSPWSSPVKIWAEKTGLIVPEDISQKFHIRYGNKFEPVVAEMYMEETGEKVHRVNNTLYHPKYKFIAANLDYRVVGKNKGLECKTTSSYRGDSWKGDDDMPPEVVVQCLHQMAVTGYQEWDAAVLIGNSDFKIKTIKRDEAAIQNLIKAEVEFWETFVVPKVMPDKFTARDKDTLDQLYPEGEDDKTIMLGDEEASMIEMLEGLNDDAKTIEKQIETIKNTLRAKLGTAEVGLTAKHKVFWTNARIKRFNKEAFDAAHPNLYDQFKQEKNERRFLIKALKEAKNANDQ